ARGQAARQPQMQPVAEGGMPRGELTEKVMAALRAAGESGLSVSEMAEFAGTKAANIYAWLSGTAKKITGVRRLGEGRYHFLEGANGEQTSAATTAVAKAPAAAAVRPAKAPRPSGGTKRGALTEAILRELRTAGDKGISVKELADKLNAKYKNLYIWFSTTGKKNPAIKKVGPATYKLAAA